MKSSEFRKLLKKAEEKYGDFKLIQNGSQPVSGVYYVPERYAFELVASYDNENILRKLGDGQDEP